MVQKSDSLRKTPTQQRARQTLDDILEAAAQLFEADCGRDLNTNRVAERAGVSIGTLYYYFPNKVSLLAALAMREIARQEHLFLGAIAAARPGGAPAIVRAIVQQALAPLMGRTELRRRLIGHAGFDPSVRDALHAALDRVTDGLLAAIAVDPARVPRERRFMLLRSVLGPVRAAALYAPDLLASRLFEEDLVRHAMAMLADLEREAPPAGRGDEGPAER